MDNYTDLVVSVYRLRKEASFKDGWNNFVEANRELGQRARNTLLKAPGIKTVKNSPGFKTLKNSPGMRAVKKIPNLIMNSPGMWALKNSPAGMAVRTNLELYKKLKQMYDNRKAAE